MGEVVLGPVLRALLGLLGIVALLAGAVVGATELRIAASAWLYWPAVAAAAVCAVIGYAGALLLRGAWRGRIAVRRPLRQRATRQRP